MGTHGGPWGNRNRNRIEIEILPPKSVHISSDRNRPCICHIPERCQHTKQTRHTQNNEHLDNTCVHSILWESILFHGMVFHCIWGICLALNRLKATQKQTLPWGAPPPPTLPLPKMLASGLRRFRLSNERSRLSNGGSRL